MGFYTGRDVGRIFCIQSQFLFLFVLFFYVEDANSTCVVVFSLFEICTIWEFLKILF